MTRFRIESDIKQVKPSAVITAPITFDIVFMTVYCHFDFNCFWCRDVYIVQHLDNNKKIPIYCMAYDDFEKLQLMYDC